MRNLFIIGMLLVAAFMAGWFKVNRDGERTTIEINRSEIRGDARNAINRGREYLDQREQQYADQQQSADAQQYANQPQYDDSQYSNGGQQAWPQVQVAAQQDAWGNNYDYRQPPPNTNYQTQPYQNQLQDQRYPSRAIDPQPQYPPQPYYNQ